MIYKGRACKEYFNPIIGKMQDKLARWKTNFLSHGGRLILIKHVISTMPLYIMGIFDIFQGVIDKFNKIIFNFFWGKNDGMSNMHWLKWESICKLKAKVGLGVRDFNNVMYSFRMKQAWNILKNQGL
jgi:hypothetical protein